MIIDILGTGKDRELCHECVRSPYVPRGSRVDAFYENLNRDVSIDDSIMIASLCLADIADYITEVFDSNFALIRYAESLTASSSTFTEIAKSTEAPVMTEYYKPVLKRTFNVINDAIKKTNSTEQKILFCVSVPFPGVFAAALTTCKAIRQKFGNKAIISIGGGYVSTAL